MKGSHEAYAAQRPLEIETRHVEILIFMQNLIFTFAWKKKKKHQLSLFCNRLSQAGKY